MKSTIIILIILTININLFADCDGTSFRQNYFNNYMYDSSMIFVQGIKVEDYYHGIKLKILENYSSRNLNDTILIWYCNPYQLIECNAWDVQSTHKVNDTLICLLTKTKFLGNIINCDTCPAKIDTIDLEKIGDYMIVNCYPSILKLSQGKVTGWIFDAYRDTTILYSDFENLFINPSDIIVKDIFKKDIKVYPNPTISEIQIILPRIKFIKRIEIYNNLGVLVDKKNLRKEISVINYSLENFESGQYYIRLVFSDNIITKQIIKI